MGVAVADQLGAYHLVYGILGALYYREKTGKGQEISVDLFRSVLAFCGQEFMTTLNMEVNYERPNSGIGHPFSDAPFGIYKCSDGHITLAMGNFEVLCEILEAPSIWEKYQNPQDRFDKRDEMFIEIETITKTKSTMYWLQKLREKDYWSAEIKDITEVPDDVQVKHINAITSYTHSKFGTIRCVAPAITMSETPLDIHLAPPTVGEHSEGILKTLGLSEEEIQELIQNNIVSNG